MVHTVNLDEQLAEELATIAAEAGCELIHAEYRGGALRLFLDRPEGVTLKDCEIVSKEASALLDVADFGRGRYTLEVSSPGLDRQLYTHEDYQRFEGHLVRVTYRDPERRQKATIVGRLEEFRAPIHVDGGDLQNGDRQAGDLQSSDLQDSQIVIIESDRPGRERRHGIALRDIEIARLEIEL